MKKTYFKKTTYTSPEVELLVVRGGEVFCGSPVYGDPGEAGGEIGSGDTYNL
ncbi:MAG: hypothetical protein K6F58_05245 [Bacteroidales bacterium]|nr:hypothetical protein [Bacteroidales bacterium]